MGDVPTRPKDDQVAWGVQSHGEPRWPELLAVLAANRAQLVLPDTLVRGLETERSFRRSKGAAVVPSSPTPGGYPPRNQAAHGRGRLDRAHHRRQHGVWSSIHALLYGSRAGGRPLVYASVPIWLTNVIVFGLWSWGLDRGGPAKRQRPTTANPIFSFRRCPHRAAPGWAPDFSITSTRPSRSDRLQPHRHHAAHRLGQVAHDAPVPGLAGHGGRRRLAGVNILG